MSQISQFIIEYGYLALFIGCLAEGETAALLGGISAHQQLLDLPVVYFIVAFGGCLGDILLFFVGYYFGSPILARFTRYQQKIQQAQRMIHHHPALFVVGVRFMYGFRLIGPVILGASRLPIKLFLALNLLGAILWSAIFVSLGYLGGAMVEQLLDNIDNGITLLVGIIVLAIIISYLFWRYKKKKASQREAITSDINDDHP